MIGKAWAGPGRLAALVVWVGLAACGPGDADAARSVPALEGGAGSLEELGAGVWAAVVAGDTAALRALRITRTEHDQLVWPEQPAAREPSANANLDLWWGNIQTRDRAAVGELVAAFGESEARLVATRCPRDQGEYQRYRALTDCRLVLEAPDGSEQAVEAFRHVIVANGRYKVVRYYDG